MRYVELLDIDLRLFDGAEGGGEGGQGESGDTGETARGSADAGQGKKTGETQKVIYGKPDAAAAEQEETGETETPDAGEGKELTQEERIKRYRELVGGEYKDLYDKDVQHIIRERFKETGPQRERQKKAQAIIELMLDKYEVEDGDLDRLNAAIENDDAMWARAAEEAGMAVGPYKELFKYKHLHNVETRERQAAERAAEQERKVEDQVKGWVEDAARTMGDHPGFDLGRELKNPDFVDLLQRGVGVRAAYRAVHYDELLNGAVRETAEKTEKKMTDHIRARGARPVENGTAAQSGFVVKSDPGSLTREDFEEIARRVARGEKIQF